MPLEMASSISSGVRSFGFSTTSFLKNAYRMLVDDWVGFAVRSWACTHPPVQGVEREAEVAMDLVRMAALVWHDLRAHPEAVQAQVECWAHRALDPQLL